VSKVHWSLAAGLAGTLFVPATRAKAQSPSSYSDVPDRFRIEAGGFRLGSSTDLTFTRGGVPATPVDFERIGLPENTTRGYLEGFWRPGRRHQLSLSFYRINRGGDPTTVSRDINWGDRVITAGATVSARTDSNFTSGVYRFAAYKNDRFEIGPSLGIGYLHVEAGIRGQAGVTRPDGPPTIVPFDESMSLGQATGDLGGYLYWWALPRLLVRGDMRYIIVKPGDSEASITDGRGAVLYHPWRKFGIGLQYTYTKFRYDRDILSTSLGGSLRYRGGQLVLAGAF
jgi:hypothetical protein